MALIDTEAAQTVGTRPVTSIGGAPRWIILAIALGEVWIWRYSSNPDGTAYIDIAKAWLRGDWAHALSTYWSPLNSWLLAALFAFIKPDAASTLPLVHVVNFIGFLACLGGWEFLFAEWETWQGPPVHPQALRLAGYSTLLWATLHLLNLGANAADVFVIAIQACLSALLIRVRRGSCGVRGYAAIGALLGLGFLAKAACVALFPFCAAAVALLLRSVRDRRVWIVCGAACLTIAPFVAAISWNAHRLVLSDTGRLNYAMLVDGFSIEGYKDNAVPPPVLPHSFLARSEDPRVLSFEKHVVGTYPVHNDPVWWLEGLPTKTSLARQWFTVKSGTLFTLWLFLGCPAIVVALVDIRAWARSFLATCARLWFVIVPAGGLLLAYAIVLVHSRYIAGSLAIAGFVVIAAMWRTKLSEDSLLALQILLTLSVFGTMWAQLIAIPGRTAAELLRLAPPSGIYNLDNANALRREGVRPGDRVGFIGNGFFAGWVGLAEAQIVAIVPPRMFHESQTLGRNLFVTFGPVDRYWHSPPEAQRRALAAMRAAGAKWVLADSLPKDVTPAGWKAIGVDEPYNLDPSRSDVVYCLKLDGPEPAAPVDSHRPGSSAATRSNLYPAPAPATLTGSSTPPRSSASTAL